MEVQVEIVLLGLSLLFLISMLVSKAGSRFGVPALLLFLAVGMIAGRDGLGVEFNDIHTAQNIGTIALCIILFSGGLDTKLPEIRPVLAQGIVLATAGVLLMALTTGALIWWISGMTAEGARIGFITSLLLASTMSSTDSASVFAILRSRGLRLKNNLRPLLELESGSNDPMAYVLVITLISMVQMGSEPNYWQAAGMVLLQLCIGALAGFGLGKLSVWIINRIRIDNASLYPILVFTFCIFIFSATYFLYGNGFLAVYLAGLVIGNSKFVHKRTSLNFFDGLAWLSQLIMFLTLGLLVNPKDLIAVIVPGLIISFLMIIVTRPFCVFLCLLPFRKMANKDKLFVSWVGLRGAVPVIFAIIPLASGVPNADYIFNIVFFCTLVSLLIQGTSLAQFAMWLGLAGKPQRSRRSDDFDIAFADNIKTVTSEITITREALKHGTTLMNMPLPEHTLVVMVKREDLYFVPTGSTELQENDRLLVIANNQEALEETYKRLEK